MFNNDNNHTISCPDEKNYTVLQSVCLQPPFLMILCYRTYCSILHAVSKVTPKILFYAYTMFTKQAKSPRRPPTLLRFHSTPGFVCKWAGQYGYQATKDEQLTRGSSSDLQNKDYQEPVCIEIKQDAKAVL